VLIVAGVGSDFVAEKHLIGLRAWFGDNLDVITVPGGHLVLWDAFDETADAIEAFVST
jgi:hypothetical protein